MEAVRLDLLIFQTLAVALINMLGAMPAVGQDLLEPLNQTVSMVGEIREVHGYGPPNYGEDKNEDAAITYMILELANPINTVCKPDRPEWSGDECKATKQVELFFPTLPSDNGIETRARAMVSKRVTVIGTLHRADTMGEMTPIYMDVAELHSN
jgi:hypothetical protein